MKAIWWVWFALGSVSGAAGCGSGGEGTEAEPSSGGSATGGSGGGSGSGSSSSGGATSGGGGSNSAGSASGSGGGSGGTGGGTGPCSPGEVLWQTIEATQIASNADGAVALSFFEQPPGGNENIEVVVYDASGARLWRVTHNGDANMSDRGAGIALLPSGDVVVAGSVGLNIGSETWLSRRVAADGRESWTLSREGSAPDYLLSDEDVFYGVGRASVEKRSLEDGSEQWTVDTTIHPSAVAATEETIYVVGNDIDSDDDVLAAFSKSDGAEMWLEVVEVADHETPEGLAVDGMGSLWTTGRQLANGTAYLRKYDSDGGFVTESEFDAGGAGDFGGAVIALGDRIVVGGQGPATDDGWLASFDTSATAMSSVDIDGNADVNRVQLMAPALDGSVYVAGPLTPLTRVCLPR